MTDDAELLRRYAKDQSEDAFAELVGRHLNLVYAAALRLVGGDAHRAKDVAQQVFTALARQADPLSRHASLIGWLYTCTRYTAAKIVRTEQRRQKHEQEAQTMHELLASEVPEAGWDRLRPVLDDVMGELDARDREAVLLRFFESQPFGHIGAVLRLTEDAARMRVERALERMRLRLTRRGFTSTSVALAAILTTQAAAAAPAGLQGAIASGALAGATAGAGTFSLLAAINLSKSYLVIGAAVALLGFSGIVLQHELSPRLRVTPARSTAVELRPAPTAEGEAAQDGGRVFEPAMLDQPPVPIYHPQPLYPKEMKEQGLAGQVVVAFIVNAQGTVEEAAAVSSTHHLFEAATLQTVSTWRYKPGRRGDQPVSTRLRVPVNFLINAAD